jgi:DnaJ-domain-containing protein 1
MGIVIWLLCFVAGYVIVSKWISVRRDAKQAADPSLGYGFQERGRKNQNYRASNGGRRESGYRGSSHDDYENDRDSFDECDCKYYFILAVSRSDGFEEIKKKYREILGQYHPDKVQHLGREFQIMAEEKTKAINEAFAYFEQKFGM